MCTYLWDEDPAHLVVASRGCLHEGSQSRLQQEGDTKMVMSQDIEFLLTMPLSMCVPHSQAFPVLFGFTIVCCNVFIANRLKFLRISCTCILSTLPCSNHCIMNFCWGPRSTHKGHLASMKHKLSCPGVQWYYIPQCFELGDALYLGRPYTQVYIPVLP